jgi:hypothetical protein
MTRICLSYSRILVSRFAEVDADDLRLFGSDRFIFLVGVVDLTGADDDDLVIEASRPPRNGDCKSSC